MSDDEFRTADATTRAIAQAGRAIATQLKYLGTGDNGSQLGAVEYHATQTVESAQVVAEAITTAGAAIENGLLAVAQALRER
jgi:hypothetical protein